MLTVRLSPEQEKMLNDLSKKTGRSKSHYVKQALDQFLEESYDYLTAIASLEKSKKIGERHYSLEEVMRELDIQN